jgi:hypothetical protein
VNFGSRNVRLLLDPSEHLTPSAAPDRRDSRNRKKFQPALPLARTPWLD